MCCRSKGILIYSRRVKAWGPSRTNTHTPGVLFLQTLHYALRFFRSQMWPSALPRDLRVPSVPGSALIGPTNVSSESANPIWFFDELQNKVQGGGALVLARCTNREQRNAERLILSRSAVAGGPGTPAADLHLPMKPLTTTYLQCIYKLSRPYKMSNLQAPF